MKTSHHNYIMGINCAYHESSVCILKDGELVAFIEEERLNRIKHAKPALITNADELPLQSIHYCLNSVGINFSDVDHIAFNFDPKERLDNSVGLDGDHAIHENEWGTPIGEKLFYDKNLNTVAKLSEIFGRDVTDIFHWVKHHVAHGAGTYYSSGFDSAAILIVDGIAEHCSTWVGAAHDTKIEKYYEIDYPNSIGFVWEKMSEFLGFTEYEAEKVMGLASYGNYERELPAMMKLLHADSGGKFVVDNDVLLFRTSDFSQLEKLFGVVKREKEDPLTQKHKDIAGALQLSLIHI
jgi:carbamoyltransferase